MKLRYIFTLTLGLTLVWADNEVVQIPIINDSDFYRVIVENDFVYAQFLDFSCYYCKLFISEYKKILDFVEKTVPFVKITTINSKQENITAVYRIEEFPTIKLFVLGNPVDYFGLRRGEEIIEWIFQVVQSNNVRELSSHDDIKEALTLELAGLIVLANDDENQLRDYKSLAANYPKIQFFYTRLLVEGIRKEFLINFIVIRNFDTGHKTLGFNQTITYPALRSFFEGVKNPGLNLISKEFYEETFKRKETIMCLFHSQNQIGVTYAFYDVAKSQPNAIKYCLCPYDAAYSMKLLKTFGITMYPRNFIGILRFRRNHLDKFVTTDLDQKSILKFISDFQKDNLRRHYKSTPVHGPQTGHVKAISTEEMQETIFDTPNHVVLIIYSPVCAQCKTFLEITEKIAKEMDQSLNLEFYKIDGMENEHELLEIVGFPTIYLFKKGRKIQPIEYRMRRKMKEFVQFLELELGIEYLFGNMREDLLAKEESL